MASLKISDSGITLDNSEQASKSLAPLAFGTVLDEVVIEDMIQCVRNGESIDLVFGPDPYFELGSEKRRHELDITPESVECDLYLTTNPTDPAPKTHKFPNSTRSLFEKPPTPEKPAKGKRAGKPAASNATAKGAKGAKGTSKAATAKANKAASILPPGKSAMSQALSGAAARSLPPSPGLTSAASPSNNPAASATQQLFEKNKEQRSVLVHELAAKDQTFEELADTWTGTESELKPTLEKVASVDQASKTWSLKKLYWKELDVWKYSYSNPDDRQKAIDNAIRNYDRQRIGATSPEWERLLAPEERGKGIILSKLQATLAKGNINPTPKPGTSKPEEAAKSDSEPPKPKSAPMSRNSSQSTTTPKPAAKKPADLKRPAASAAPKKTVAPPKKPVAKVKATDEKTGRGPLSEEFVVDSDSSEDEALSTQAAKSKTAEKPAPRPAEKTVPKPAARTADKATEKPAQKVVEKSTEKRKVSPASAPAAKPKHISVVRAPRAPAKAAQPTPQKRARDDDDSSSSSGAPLSKRIKPKELPKPAPSTTKMRDAADQPTKRSAVPAPTAKSKNTSPTKSSPLASSPPTNASDMEDRAPARNRVKQQRPAPERDQVRNGDRARNGDRPNGVANGVSPPLKKRKPETERVEPVKKPRISEQILELSQRFQTRYSKYENLHLEIAGLAQPPQTKIDKLLGMREALTIMKKEINMKVEMAGAA